MSTDPLISHLQNDLLLNILKHSEDIGKCATHITSQIREIIGVRVVALFERLPDGSHHLAGASPERKQNLFDDESMARLIDLASSLQAPTLITPGRGDLGVCLLDLGMNESFVVPLRVGIEGYGFLLLLDIMDNTGIGHVLDMLTDISGLLSLILKNAFLFKHLETLVARRSSELLESETRSRSILQVALDGFWIIDGKGRIVDVNDAYCTMSGYSRNELLTLTVAQLEARETEQEVAEAAQRVLAGSKPRFETIHRRKDDSLLYIDLVAQRLPGRDDQIFAFIRDITEKKLAEIEHEKLQVQLAQAQKMESVGRLAGGVAHDFNNMLGVILGHTELAMDQTDPQNPLYDDLTEIQKAAQRSADLTRQLLAFARKQTITPKILDLNVTVTGMLKMLQRLIGENISLSWSPGPDLWPVRMDPSQIDQILANLCVNARDAITGVGSVRIETKNVTVGTSQLPENPDELPGEYVRLTVEDTGSGIDAQDLTTIFEPFFTTKPLGQGTGLGLATVYGIVRQNRGFIQVASAKNQGTSFHIHLPYHSRNSDIETFDKKESDVQSDGHKTILLVEDEPAILKMIGNMLNRLGYNVLSATSPQEAIGISREYKGRIHLLMTDVIMPEMSGRELARHIEEEDGKMKYLFMSGYTADLVAPHGVLENGIAFLQKPFSKAELSEAVKKVLLNS